MQKAAPAVGAPLGKAMGYGPACRSEPQGFGAPVAQAA
jgi:hypothetical protein